jgi:ubiquinone/menaquinone biosynthesis C-methylase UbiE
VVEIGAGNGLNFRHYPNTVTEVTAIEPEPLLRRVATEAAATANVPIRVLEGAGERLPGEDDAYDAAVASLVLCTVPDPGVALAEIRRVLRRGGELRFYEHVVSNRTSMALVQRIGDATIWPRIAGGCHAARDTATTITHAGFDIETIDRFPFKAGAWQPPVPHILGVARAR